jgi:hypothetical protein
VGPHSRSCQQEGYVTSDLKLPFWAQVIQYTLMMRGLRVPLLAHLTERQGVSDMPSRPFLACAAPSAPPEAA